MNKKELIEQIALDTGDSKAATTRFVDAYENAIKEAVSSGENIDLYNFLKIEIKDVAERVGTNPRTKERITIPAHKKVAIKPLTGLKSCVVD